MCAKYIHSKTMKLCECSCGKLIPEFSIHNGKRIERRFKHGHSNPAKKGHKHHNWKGGKHQDNKGYIQIYIPEHPYCDKKGYVPEHRLVKEFYLKRFLTDIEEIHHINGIKFDNRNENLMLTNRVEHQSIHSTGKLCRPKRDLLTGRFIKS